MARCKLCGMPIQWEQSVTTGKWYPLDVELINLGAREVRDWESLLYERVQKSLRNALSKQSPIITLARWTPHEANRLEHEVRNSVDARVCAPLRTMMRGMLR